MKILTVTPLWFERDHNGLALVSKVEFYGYDRRKRPKLWWSPRDVTVEQLCEDVGRKFHADEVNFQPPLLTLSTREFHAADYL